MKKFYFVLFAIFASLSVSFNCYAVNEQDIFFKSFVEGYQWDNYLTEHYGTDKIMYNGNDLGEIYVVIYETNNEIILEIVMVSEYWKQIRVFDKCTIVENAGTYDGNRREFNLKGNYFKQMRVERNQEDGTAQFKLLGKNKGLLVLDTKVFIDAKKLFSIL